MKIYPNKNKISIKNNINQATDIPLAYIDTDSSAIKLDIKYNSDCNNQEKKEILPYDEVSTQMCLFDNNENLIPYSDMIRNFIKDKDKYVYVPKDNAISFEPKRFEYIIRAKKNIKYKANNIYNLTVSVYNNKHFANRLMQIFGDAANRNMAPHNVIINNADKSLNLYSNIITDNDINFLYLKNKNTILLDNDYIFTFDKNVFMNNNNTNLFLVLKNDNAINITKNNSYNKDIVNLLFSETYNTFTLNKPNIYNTNIMSKYYFNIPKDTNEIVYHNIFNNNKFAPILIEEHINKGYIVYIPEYFINNLSVYYFLIYEVMLYIYLNGYKTSNIINSWVSDEAPEYTVKNKSLLKYNQSLKENNINSLLNLSDSEIKSYEIIIDSNKYPFVKYAGDNKLLTFEKIKGDNNQYIDPIKKPEGYISIYSGNRIFYYKNFIYKINDSIEDCVNITNNDNKEIIINLKDYRNSDKGIYIKANNDSIKIPLIKVINKIETQIINQTYYLICKENDSVSQYELVEDSNYKDGIILVTIKVLLDEDNNKKIVYDMRQRGGGLPENEKDNFDCFDIGNIYGRPYRKGSSLIITLPGYLKPHKDFIMNIVKQYMVADDYPIILFKEG